MSSAVRKIVKSVSIPITLLYIYLPAGASQINLKGNG
jgi:hypothetical protein